MEGERQLEAIDLFAGAGGFSLGAIQAGFVIAGALEMSRHAASTFRANIRNEHGQPYTLIEEDIRNIDPKTAMRIWKIEEGQCDLLIGGPPCQGFSSHRLNNSGVGDPRNELLSRYFEYVKALRPKAFLVENVAGLLWPRHKNHLDLFLHEARKAGYELVGPKLLNASDYGVPQRRKRVFILGIDKRADSRPVWPPCATHSDSAPKTEGGAELRAWLNCASAFEQVNDSDPNSVWMKSCHALVEAFRSTPPNGGSRRQSGRELKCHASHDGHSDVYGRIDPRRPAPTMTTACINPSKGRFVHPTNHRGISVREAARIQVFPDDFVFHGGLMAAGVQIGNAVPVSLARTLVSPLHDWLAQARAPEAETLAESNRGRQSLDTRSAVYAEDDLNGH